MKLFLLLHAGILLLNRQLLDKNFLQQTPKIIESASININNQDFFNDQPISNTEAIDQGEAQTIVIYNNSTISPVNFETNQSNQNNEINIQNDQINLEPQAIIRENGNIQLNITDRIDSLDVPQNVGWCGEISIQMALLYYGAFIPQKYINQITTLAQPDLYSQDIPNTLAKLKLNYKLFDNNGNLSGFLSQIKTEISNSYPVLVGVKTNPSKDDKSYIDHFVLIKGFSGDKFLINTNNLYLGAINSTLMNLSDPFSIINKYQKYFGISIRGFNFADKSLPVHIFINKENNQTHSAQIVIQCQGSANNDYKIIKYSATQDLKDFKLNNLKIVHNYIVQSSVNYAIQDNIDTDVITLYRCFIN